MAHLQQALNAYSGHITEIPTKSGFLKKSTKKWKYTIICVNSVNLISFKSRQQGQQESSFLLEKLLDFPFVYAFSAFQSRPKPFF
jgi:hypothetical protein